MPDCHDKLPFTVYSPTVHTAFVYANSVMVTATWQSYVKSYAPNQTFDYGGRATALWLDR